MKVTILDTQTGEKRECDSFDGYFWSEGNGACDCNRRIFYVFPSADCESSFCVGCNRFLIVSTDDPAYTLRELNHNYPEELLKKHGIQ